MADNLKYRRVKGTRDILPGESYQWQYVETKIAEILDGTSNTMAMCARIQRQNLWCY